MAGKLKWWEAAEIIGVTDRTMRRWREQYRSTATVACTIGASGGRVRSGYLQNHFLDLHHPLHFRGRDLLFEGFHIAQLFLPARLADISRANRTGQITGYPNAATPMDAPERQPEYNTDVIEGVYMGFRIGIIEPNPADAHWLKLMLDESGVQYEATVFPSAVAALAAFRASEAAFDIVVVNFQLPFLDLDDALSRMREACAGHRVRYAVTITLEFERALVKPGVDVLMKPVDVNQLRRLLAPSSARVEQATHRTAASPNTD